MAHLAQQGFLRGPKRSQGSCNDSQKASKRFQKASKRLQKIPRQGSSQGSARDPQIPQGSSRSLPESPHSLPSLQTPHSIFTDSIQNPFRIRPEPLEFHQKPHNLPESLRFLQKRLRILAEAFQNPSRIFGILTDSLRSLPESLQNPESL